MALTAFQIPALLLIFLGFIFLLVTTVSSNWKISSTVNTTNWNYEGLWMNCEATSLGSFQCNTLYSLLSLDKSLWYDYYWINQNYSLQLFRISFSHVCSYWKVSTVLGNVITTSTLYENLWHSCAEESTGISNCKAFNSLLALPAFIQACRALMITSLVLGMGGTLLALLGLKCTQLGSSDERKARLSIMSGMIFLLAGLSSMVALSWYAANITAEFFDPLYAGTKYELGYALYLGWAGSLLSIVGGILLTCSSCKGNQRDHGYHYAASATVDEPQIYIKQAKTVTPAKDYV